MPEPMRTLYLEGLKLTGSLTLGALRFEERFTIPQLKKLLTFAGWLKKNNLSVGHGTIDLRWCEFQRGDVPISKEHAYEIAMNEAGYEV